MENKMCKSEIFLNNFWLFSKSFRREKMSAVSFESNLISESDQFCCEKCRFKNSSESISSSCQPSTSRSFGGQSVSFRMFRMPNGGCSAGGWQKVGKILTEETLKPFSSRDQPRITDPDRTVVSRSSCLWLC